MKATQLANSLYKKSSREDLNAVAGQEQPKQQPSAMASAMIGAGIPSVLPISIPAIEESKDDHESPSSPYVPDYLLAGRSALQSPVNKKKTPTSQPQSNHITAVANSTSTNHQTYSYNSGSYVHQLQRKCNCTSPTLQGNIRSPPNNGLGSHYLFQSKAPVGNTSPVKFTPFSRRNSEGSVYQRAGSVGSLSSIGTI